MFQFHWTLCSFVIFIRLCGNDVIAMVNRCQRMKSLKLEYCMIERDVLCNLNWEELILNYCYFEEVCWNGVTTLNSLEIVASDLVQLDKLLENNDSIEVLKLDGSLGFDDSVLTILTSLQYFERNSYTFKN